MEPDDRAPAAEGRWGDGPTPPARDTVHTRPQPPRRAWGAETPFPDFSVPSGRGRGLQASEQSRRVAGGADGRPRAGQRAESRTPRAAARFMQAPREARADRSWFY